MNAPTARANVMPATDSAATVQPGTPSATISSARVTAMSLSAVTGEA